MFGLVYSLWLILGLYEKNISDLNYILYHKTTL